MSAIESVNTLRLSRHTKLNMTKSNYATIRLLHGKSRHPVYFLELSKERLPRDYIEIYQK